MMNLRDYIKKAEDIRQEQESDNLILENIFSKKGSDSEENGGLLNYIRIFILSLLMQFILAE